MSEIEKLGQSFGVVQSAFAQAGCQFYKYRALTDCKWKRLVDIFVHERLYASGFQSLNDPMEGRYYYGQGSQAQGYIDAIRNEKRQWRICSLSQCCDDPQMWALYANGHNGIAIGLELPRLCPDEEVREVKYVGTLDFEKQSDVDSTAKWILSRKLSNWTHEKEYRVLTKQLYVPIQIKQLLLGCKVSQEDEELLTDLLNGLHPKVSVERYESDAMPVR